jgi:rhamnulose-1-phosphate aldolase
MNCPELNPELIQKVNECIRVCEASASKNWAEANAGNISVLIDLKYSFNDDTKSDWLKLPENFSSLANRLILLSASGSVFRDAALNPEKSFGFIEIDTTGSLFRKVWGFADNGKPTSEWMSHLGILSSRIISGTPECVVFHAHTPYLVALCNIMELDSEKLSRLIWEMHGEGMMFVSDGVEYLSFEVSGTADLYDKTREAFLRKRIVVWEYHGAVSVGVTPAAAFGLMELCEKAAQNYCIVSSSGGFKKKITGIQLLKIASTFGLNHEL